MLTPIDIHYLVGLLSVVSSPEDVEIELGSLVDDVVAEEARDVDITIIQRTPDGLRAFQGLEVKDHSRPLDVGHVEQLCAKLRDMPALTERFIVSASGYTGPARRKARARAVELLQLVPFSPESMSTWDRRFPEDLEVCERTLHWLPVVNVKFEIADAAGANDVECSDSLIVLDSGGSPIPGCPNLAQLKQNMLLSALNELKSKEDVTALPDGTPHALTYVLVLADSPRLEWPGQYFTILHAIVQGSVAWRTSIHPPLFMVLLRDHEKVPLVACAVAELASGALVGLVLSPTDPRAHVIHVSISDRNRRKIRKQRLR